MSAFIVASPLGARGTLASGGASAPCRTLVVTRAIANVTKKPPNATLDDNSSGSSSGAGGRRTALLSSLSSATALGALAAAPAPAAAGKQPIDWLFEETVGGAVSVGSTIKDSLAESGVAGSKGGSKGGSGEGEGEEGGTNAGEEEGDGGGGGFLNAGTAFKFGKLGAILVFADVVTFFVMGRSVLGVMDDGGEEGWKEKMADKILARAEAKDAAAAAAGGEGKEEGEGEDKQPPAA